ncbi:CYTOCHROME P450 FAMILY 76 SUBFAMILY C POLYPEPTIDE 5-RELATED [Salix purpurea]|uniref:CYTOCHROME P450 FAMILY 76 SUBFAMILY C POLYPEPTIDE 5-RELATED n=1 Tax=Salix purpurea TaxID=77065 RepID=A0A9Q0VFS2_SALPP|nr:CYTOCHROME P450 FAMILY 76 SUBFAMILY C POLYPEPTIDE 5-RELATED [Salix purpurea]
MARFSNYWQQQSVVSSLIASSTIINSDIVNGVTQQLPCIHGSHGFSKCFSRHQSIFSHVVSSSSIIVAFPLPETQTFQSPGDSTRAKTMATDREWTQLVVIGSSRKAASEILKTHDRELSGRCVPHVSFAKDPNLNEDSIAWTFECTDRWKFFRSLMRNELFSSKAVDGQSSTREAKAREMIDFLRKKEGERVKIRDIVFAYIFNALANIYLSKDLLNYDQIGECQRVCGLVREMMELHTALNISDMYPILGSLDLQGLSRKCNEGEGRIQELWRGVIKERREGRNDTGDDDNSSKRKDFLDVLLDGQFSDEQISLFLVELLAAVSDSTSSTVEWAMAELMGNPQAMKRLREELAGEIPEELIAESSLAKFPYLHSCFKETLRLHPPAPFLIPHRATEDCQVMDYTIPKDAQVLVNVWAIARNPDNWEDPLCFKPERFLNSDLDYKGNHFEYLPFGSGRRICAGMPMAVKKVQLAFANLIHSFDWSLPNNMLPDELDMDEKYGITLMKEQPLELIPKWRK